MSIKLVYFNLYGRAECTRMLLNHAKVEFEDVRIERADWPQYKQDHAAELEWGQMPALYHDGKEINQSISVLKYVGRIYGYYPADAYEAWRVDSFHDALSDLFTAMAKARFETDAEKQKEMYGALLATTLPQTLAKFEKRLLANTSQQYLVGDKLTTIDFHMIPLFQMLAFNDKNPMAAVFGSIFDTVPTLKAYVGHHVENTFKEYLATRPVCDM